MPENIRKILIIRMSSIGDIILTTPVIRQLRQLYPNAQIDFIIRKSFADVLIANPHISNLISIDPRDKVAFAQLKTKVQESGYDAIVDLHGNFRSFSLSRFKNAPPVYRYQKNKFERFMLVKAGINFYPTKPLSVIEKYLAATELLGTIAKQDLPELHLPKKVHQIGKKMWDSLVEEKFRIVMAPGARHFTKRWLPEYYAELIQKIYTETGWKTILVGGPDEKEINTEIQNMITEPLVKNFAGEVSLLETFALIKFADYFVSNDSGLMHVAAAFQKPQVAIFGGTAQQLGFFPVNPNAIVLENNALKCRPCSHIGKDACPKKHFDCIKTVSPEMVFSAFRNHLKKLNEK